MATLVKQKGRYYLQFYCPERTPNQKRVALKTAGKRAAKSKQRELEPDYVLGNYDPKLEGAKRGFVLLPRRWVTRTVAGPERTFGWFTRFRRLVRDYERLPETVQGLHFVAFICIMLSRVLGLLNSA